MTVLVLLLICMFACGGGLAWWIWLRRRVASISEPPMYPGALPLLGHAYMLMGDSTNLWKVIREAVYESLKAGGIILMRIGTRKVYVITDPDDCLTVANTCLKKDFVYSFANSWLGEGLVTATVPTWKHHRKLINPAFSQHVLDGFLGVFNSQSRRLVKELETVVGKGPFDQWYYLGHNSLETICLTAMGVNIGEDSILNNNYVFAIGEILEIFSIRLQNFWMHNHFVYKWTNQKRREERVVKVLHEMSNSVLQRRKLELNGNVFSEINRQKTSNNKCKAFLDLLLELTVEKNAFTDREIREEVDTMIAAGHDTSATILMYTLILLGSHPEVQDKAFKEIQEVVETDRDFEKQDLSKMMYLEAVLKESLRIHSIAPIVARQVEREVKLKNYTLHPGSSCFLAIHGVHRHKMWGEDAEVFRPERWLNPASLPENPNAFSGFSFGRRMCIGRIYAMMSMKATLAHLLRHYRILSDHSQLRFKLDILLKPVSGHHISIERRA
uniref:Cytochrome P450 44 n=1 Tax=Streltzoviella insularis TaxID=1206366 RepID=A0A7D5UMU8_9NEOP|nr:cytochrome P450 44 [Streltzoviella insularis]